MATDPPMVLSDSHGLPLTTRSREAVHWYDQGICGLLGFRKDTADCYLKALALDPSFSMARSALGRAVYQAARGHTPGAWCLGRRRARYRSFFDTAGRRISASPASPLRLRCVKRTAVKKLKENPDIHE